MTQQNDLQFDMECLEEIQRRRGDRDPFQSFWDELKSILRHENPSNYEWERLDNDMVLGEVWSRPIGEFYYKHTVHQFSYLYVKSQGLVIASHGHSEPANGGKQVRKVKEFYVFPNGSVRFCGKDEEHQLFNADDTPIYVLSIKIKAKGRR